MYNNPSSEKKVNPNKKTHTVGGWGAEYLLGNNSKIIVKIVLQT